MAAVNPLAALTPPLILASASPRRRMLLARLSIPFSVHPADLAEQQLPGETPAVYVTRLAEEKAAHIAQRFPDALVLGADTVVVLDGQIMGKPAHAEQARHMLTRLSGRQHTVMTGLALIHAERHFVRLDRVSTQVQFRVLTAAEVARYIATGEPFDKAGAYAIQGHAAAFVVAVDGCYTNVVGLPVQRTARLLQDAGVPVTRLSEHSEKTAW